MRQYLHNSPSFAMPVLTILKGYSLLFRPVCTRFGPQLLVLEAVGSYPARHTYSLAQDPSYMWDSSFKPNFCLLILPIFLFESPFNPGYSLLFIPLCARRGPLSVCVGSWRILPGSPHLQLSPGTRLTGEITPRYTAMFTVCATVFQLIVPFTWLSLFVRFFLKRL